ncbi:hypothetical protein LC653_41070 [Nostoc sp. CHAB 5784]|nr:hypothetical protein [Nostoc mirabile]MCC5670023.1 hypothetical protein [Nostoc mirabile CHAB5784]
MVHQPKRATKPNLRARFPTNTPLITPLPTSAALSAIKERIDRGDDGLAS